MTKLLFIRKKILSVYLTKVIVSFLSGRSFHVSVNKTDSATHPIPYVVPQGVILSPSLYNFFTADSFHTNESETVTFVDDTAIFVSSGDPGVVCDILQRHLDSLSTYFKQWKIKINAVKTQAIYFTRCWFQGNCQLLISGLGAILSHGPQK
jgi:hypothetical protein